MYKRPYDPKRPQVCFDERPKQLVAEVRVPLPRCPGRPAHYDYEYKRNGVANIFMMFEPLAGKRHVKVTERRTKKDWAECMRQLVDEIYPQAERIVVVMDNLNTHTRHLCMRLLSQQKQNALLTNLRFITRPNMAVG